MRTTPRGNARGAGGAPLAVIALLAVLTIVAVACGGGTSGGSASTRPADEGVPRRGGSLVYGVEADTSGGFCLPESEAALSGWLVTMSVYDPLVWPNAEGKLVPYLAQSVTPNRTYDAWTIRLRSGITFQDGSPLDAQTLKLNLDAYRGHDTNLRPVLSAVVFRDVAAVTVTGPLTVVVKTTRPWVSFPSYLFGMGKMGIAAKAQLANRATCPRNLIGTGPFMLQGKWTPGTPIKLVRNPHYWRKDEHGVQLPYLDALTFVGVPEQSQRINELQGGQLDIVHMPTRSDVNKLQRLAAQGSVRVYLEDKGREVRYYLLNAGREPFSDLQAREAFAYAIDRNQINLLLNQGKGDLANGPFDKGVLGNLPGLAAPQHDLARARRLVAAVKARLGSFHVVFAVNPDASSQAEAELLRQQAKKAGIDVTMERVDQTTEISRALAGDFDVLLWRNHAGEDPDTQYLWWYSTYPTNFNHFKDPVVDKLLDEGRTNPDPGARKQAYEELNRRFASQFYDVWAWYTDWAVATRPNVRGVLGPALPDGTKPYPILAGMHPTVGLWVSG